VLNRADKRIRQEARKSRHTVALPALWYNFVRIRKTLRMPPAMAAWIEARLRSMEAAVAPNGRRDAMRAGTLPVG